MIRVDAINCKGGQESGRELAALMKKRKPKLSPYVAILCELDGGAGNTDRIQKALEAEGITVYRNRNGKTHGEREVGFATLGRLAAPAFKVEQLTENTNPPGPNHEWAPHHDRWLATLSVRAWLFTHMFGATHTPTGTRLADGSWSDTPEARNWRRARTAKINPFVRGNKRVTLGGDYNEKKSFDPTGSLEWGKAHGLVSYVSGVGWIQTNEKVNASGFVRLDPKVSDHHTAPTVDMVAGPAPKPKPVNRLYIPGARQEPIPKTTSDPYIIPVGDIFHVCVCESPDLHDFFSHDGGIESTGYILRDGTVIQFRPLNVECDAQFDGNSWIGNDGKRYGFNSWETQGMATGEWTPQQIASMKNIMSFKHDHWGNPLRQAPAWNAPGMGYHALFSRWNKTAHSCPGPDRIAQWKRVIVPWLNTQ